MRNGICPKCNSASVHSMRVGVQLGDAVQGVFVRTSSFISPTPYDSYVCVACGYFENYLADVRVVTEVAAKWPRVQPAKQ